MRALTLVLAVGASALLLATGCFVRPWAIEESERIDRLMDFEVDDAEGEAFAGISAPRWVSPGSAEVAWSIDGDQASTPAPKRKKSSASKGSKKPVPFSSLTPTMGKASKKR